MLDVPNGRDNRIENSSFTSIENREKLEVMILADVNKRGVVVGRNPVSYSICLRGPERKVLPFPFSKHETAMIAKIQPEIYRFSGGAWQLVRKEYRNFDRRERSIMLRYEQIDI